MRNLLPIAAIVALLLVTPPSHSADTPQSAASHFTQGEQFRQKGDLESAIDEYILALELKPESILSRQRLIACQSARIEQLKAELAQLRGQFGTGGQTQGNPGEEKGASSLLPEPQHDLASEQYDQIVALKKDIAAIKADHPSTFGPRIAPRVSKSRALSLSQALARFSAVDDRNDLTKLQKAELFRSIPPQPFEEEGRIKDVRESNGTFIVDVAFGDQQSAAVEVPRSEALLARKGSWCEARGVVTGGTVTIHALTAAGIGKVVASTSPDPTPKIGASPPGAPSAGGSGTRVPKDSGLTDDQLRDRALSDNERANEHFRMADSFDECNFERALKERRTGCDYLARRDQAMYLLACRLLKKGNRNEARRLFVDVITSQGDSSLGKAAQAKHDAITRQEAAE